MCVCSFSSAEELAGIRSDEKPSSDGLEDVKVLWHLIHENEAGLMSVVQGMVYYEENLLARPPQSIEGRSVGKCDGRWSSDGLYDEHDNMSID